MKDSWTETFGKKAAASVDPRLPDLPHPESDEPAWAPPPDPAEYRPWLMQRGGRPALFIDLRRFEPKTGMLIGSLMSYPALIAMDYIGDHMLALDFGSRQFVIEGKGLDGLAARLQQGMVLAIQEFSPKVWANSMPAQVVRKIATIALKE